MRLAENLDWNGFTNDWFLLNTTVFLLHFLPGQPYTVTFITLGTENL
jgi:hypothetical protein